MDFTNPNPSIIADKKLYIFDMDGTIYLGYNVFDFAIRFINNLRAAGKKILFFTNNASHSTAFYVNKLTKLGFSPTPDEIMTSGDVTIEFLKRHRAGKSVYLVGTDELVENFRENGINLLNGDGLALHLGISRNYRTALKTVLAGRTVSMDAATINGRPFFSVCGIGFDAVVSERFAKSGKRGLLSYIEQGLKTWREYAPDKYIIRIDGQEWTNDAALITVGNSNQWGNGAKITPHADISDGLLDVTIVDMFNAIEMPELARLLMTGHLDNYSKVHCYKGKNISIIRSATGPAHADGDWFVTGETIDISINPHALKVIVP